MESLDDVVAMARQGLEATPDGHPERPRRLYNLGAHLCDRYTSTGAMADLNEAIVIVRQAAEATPENHLIRAAFLDCVGSYLVDRYNHAGDVEDLRESIDIGLQVVKDTPKDHPLRGTFLSNLSSRLSDQFTRSGAMTDLEDAIIFAQKAVEATPQDHPDRAARLNDLGIRLSDRYTRFGEMTDLEEAINLGRQAVAATSEDQITRAAFLNNLGARIGDRHTRTGAIADLEEAINISRQALEATPDDHPIQAALLDNLGSRLCARFKCTGGLLGLEEAISVGQQALEATPIDHPDRAGRLNNLGTRLYDRYRRAGAMADLEEAITNSQQAVHATPRDHIDRATFLNNLGTYLGDRHARTGTMEDLEDAITTARQAVEVTPRDHPDRAAHLNNFGSRLSDRYTRTGSMADLEGAINLSRQAVDATPEDHSDRAGYLDNLGSRLFDRYRRFEAMADLEESISLSRQAIDATRHDHPHRTVLLDHLGARLGARHMRMGELADLDEAITVARQATDATPKDHPDQARFLNNLGIRLNDRYTRTRTMEDLEEAIEAGRQAVDSTPKDHPHRATFLNNLGYHLIARYRRTKDIKDVQKARLHYSVALSSKEAAVRVRVRSARRFLSTPYLTDDWHAAYDVSKTAVDLIPFLAPLSLRSADKQHQLREAAGLASDAAAIALQCGDAPLAALRLLETGRGILAESLQSIRTDLSALQDKHADLARSFLDLRDQLDEPTPRTSLELSQGRSAYIEGERRHRANEEMSRLLRKIREQPGFGQFLTSATEAQMRDAAAEGPVIVVNLSSHRCDAFIVEPAGVRAIPLPHLTADSLAEHAAALGSTKTLAWLWDVVVGPVLDALGFTQCPTSSNTWPHVWWVPTGPLTRFPLHAAGRHGKATRETALDRVVSSYGLSIKAILHTRQHRRRDETSGSCQDVVLVGMPETPGQTCLWHAAEEVDAVRDVCESVPLPYVHPSAIKQRVLAALETCRILHFAGHGGTRDDPLHSLLMLEDWQQSPLTVESLLETNLSAKAPFLAYLSACGTGRIRDEQAVDESIHLTSAFQLAGFRHVIGTLWEVDDKLCVEMARLVYEVMCRSGLRDESVSRALHHASKALRDRWLGTPDGSGGPLTVKRDATLCDSPGDDRPLWVPYVHFGL